MDAQTPAAYVPAPMDPTTTQRFSWRRVGVLLAVGVVAALIIGAIVIATDDSSTPIREQSCSELVDTLHQIQRDEAADADFDTQAQASRDGVALNERVDALGGCPDEPALQ